MKYFIMALKNYAGFTGRSRRSEFWYFALFYLIFAVVAMLLDMLLGISIVKNTEGYNTPTFSYGYIYLIYVFAMLIPYLAVSVRRLHDVGKSGWFLLIGLIPLVGGIWLLVLYFTDSQPGENKWGPNPKGIGNHSEIDEIGNYLVK